MKYLHYLILLIAGFVGLYLGLLVSPEQILYPAAPTRNESMLINYINMHSIFTGPFCATLATVVIGYGFRQSPLISLIFIPLIGVIYAVFHTLRMSLPVYIDIPLVLTYACGALTILGLVRIIEAVYEHSVIKS